MRTGLSLSGGGIRGVAHVGILKALDELGITIDIISGTSAGSLVGCLYAGGIKPDKIFELINQLSFFKSFRPAWASTGLFSMDGIRELLKYHLKSTRFDALKIPLIVTATDIKRGEAHYFRDGELLEAVIASCSIPGLFKPTNINGTLYVDGGIVDNLPTGILRKECDILIGSNCNHISSDFDLKNMKLVIERSLLLAINANTKISKSICDVVIEPLAMDRFSSLDMSKANEIFEYSYRYTKQNFQPHQFKFSINESAK